MHGGLLGRSRVREGTGSRPKWMRRGWLRWAYLSGRVLLSLRGNSCPAGGERPSAALGMVSCLSPGRDVCVAERAPVFIHVWEEPRVSRTAMNSTRGLVRQEPVALGASAVSGCRASGLSRYSNPAGAWVGRLTHPVSMVRVVVLPLTDRRWGDARLRFSRRAEERLERVGVYPSRAASPVKAHVFRPVRVIRAPQPTIGVNVLTFRPPPSVSNELVPVRRSCSGAGVALDIQVSPRQPPSCRRSRRVARPGDW